jgi:hypothetical protein
MKKSEAFHKAKTEVVMFRYDGDWAVGIAATENTSPRVIPGLLYCSAVRYRRELILERTLVYMGYPISRVFGIPETLYQSEEPPTLDMLIAEIESK